MDSLSILGLPELEEHMEMLAEAPGTPLNTKLFDDVELQVTEHNTPPLIPRLLPKLTEILSSYEGDPAVIVSLAIKLLRPLRFTDVLTLASEESLIRALQSPAPSANILAVIIIEKATKSPSDTAILSIMKGVVAAFLRTWLSSPNVGVAEKATKALGDLLEVDCNRASIAGLNQHMNGLQISAQKQPGQGLLWRRIFHDQDIYGLLYEICVPHNPGTGDTQLDERQISLAQARILRILPRLAALDFSAVSRSEFAHISSRYGFENGDLGLLYFASCQMINKQDMLMHITLIDFYAELLDLLSMTQISGSTMEYIVGLTKAVITDDKTMSKSLESLAVSPNSSPELVELLAQLKESIRGY